MKIQYQCEACKKLWGTEQESIDCESSHLHFSTNTDAKRVKLIEHFNEGDRYPREVMLFFSSGGGITYNRERK